ncbi:MAG TPA: MMPL family transporter [Vicinamibacterales bacterium]
MIRALLHQARTHRALVLAATLVLATASVFALRRLTFDANVLHLLPREGKSVPAFRTFLERFGSLDYLYVVFEAPEGHAIEDYDAEIEAFAEALAHTPGIDRVDTGPGDPSRDWGYLADRLLLILGEDLDEALDHFDPARLPAQLASTRELLTLPSPEMTALVRSDPLGLFLMMRERLAGVSAGMKVDTAGGAYVSSDGRSRLVLARPAQPPFDTDFSKALFARLAALERTLTRETAEDAPKEEAVPPPRIRYAGGHSIALEIERTVRQESIANGAGSLLLILPLLYFAFRSPWLVAVGAIPSIVAIIVVLAIYALLGRTLSAAATGAAAMQFGLGIDGVVLMFVAFRHLTSAGLSTDQAAPAMDGPAASMLLGMWTTAATFYGLAIVDFPSLEELGVLIGHSMALCGIFTLVLIPALLPSRPPTRPPLTSWWLARLVARGRTPILVGAALLTAGLGAAAMGVRVDPSLDRLRAETPGTTFEQEVARRFGVPQDVYVVLASGPSLEPLLEANEKLTARLRERMAADLAMHAPTSLLPSQAAQERAAQAIARRGLTPAGVSSALVAAASQAGFRPGTFDSFLKRLPRLLDPSERITYDGYVAAGLQELLGRSVVHRDGEWTLATYVYPAPAQVEALRTTVAEFPEMQLTGVPEVNRELGLRFGPEFLKGLAVGTALVIVLLAVTFRRVSLTLLALAPTVMALIWAGGILALAGTRLDLFSVFGVMTFVGIGVDYGIHIVHRVGHAGPEGAPEAIAHLGPVILVAALVTLLGFGTLVTSSYPPLRSLGLVSTVLIVALAVSTLLVLPALLLRGPRR